MTNNVLPIAAPPATVKAPDVNDVAAVVLEITVVPDIPALPTTCNL